MKKNNISTQLLLLFFTILLIGTCAFTIITIVYVSYIANNEVYSRLTTYSQLLLTNPNPDNSVGFPDMEIGYFVHKNTYNYTYNIDIFGGESPRQQVKKEFKEK